MSPSSVDSFKVNLMVSTEASWWNILKIWRYTQLLVIIIFSFKVVKLTISSKNLLINEQIIDLHVESLVQDGSISNVW